MKYFPINLDIRGKKALVVGGGNVALRKVRTLLACGARVTVVSLDFCTGLKRFTKVTRRERPYRKSDLRGASIVVCATNSQATNRRVYREAAASGIPVNIVDQPELCTFTVPAVFNKGDLIVTISTGGKSPALSGRIRREIEEHLDPAYAAHVRLLGQMRRRVQGTRLPEVARMRLMKRMASADITDMLRSRGPKATKEYLVDILSAENHK